MTEPIEGTTPGDSERIVSDADRANGEPEATETSSPRPRTVPPGTDTRTGTDPDATYDHAGYEDKSLGQAVAQDRELVERLIDASGGDEAEAERRFLDESAGSPALRRQAGADRRS